MQILEGEKKTGCEKQPDPLAKQKAAAECNQK